MATEADTRLKHAVPKLQSSELVQRSAFDRRTMHHYRWTCRSGRHPQQLFSCIWGAMMEPVLSFVIPVRHPINSLNHAVARRNLVGTLASVAAQTDSRWNGVVVANNGTDLPPIPQSMKVVHVDLAPSTMNRWDYSNPDASLLEFLTDKGRRVLAGLVALRPRGHVMVLDDDDLVSNRLVAFVAKSPRANGWYFADGWLWSEGDPFIYWQDEFYRYCGSSHIVRSDLVQIPPTIAEARSEYIQLLGSHQRISTSDGNARRSLGDAALPRRHLQDRPRRRA